MYVDTEKQKEQYVTHAAQCSEVMGLIPVGNSDLLFVPCLCHVDQFTFHIAHALQLLIFLATKEIREPTITTIISFSYRIL